MLVKINETSRKRKRESEARVRFIYIYIYKYAQTYNEVPDFSLFQHVTSAKKQIAEYRDSCKLCVVVK